MKKARTNKKSPAGTKHKNTEDGEKFRMLADNSSDIIFHFQFKPEPRYTYVSPSVKRILGYTPEDFYRDTMIGYKIIHPYDKKLLLNSQQNISSGKKIKKTFPKLTARYLTKKGSTVWLENRYSPIYRGKEIIAIHCISRDITEQKGIEKELNQKWMNYNSIVENLPVAAIISDMDGKIIFANPKAVELAKTQGEEYKTRNVADFVSKEFFEQIKERRQKFMEDKELPAIQVEARTKKGNKLYLEIKSAALIYNGQPAIQTIINDITAHRQLEKERLKTRTAARINLELQEEISKREESEQKLKAIFDSSTHLIWTVNKKKEITSFNEKYKDSVKLLCNHDLRTGKKLTDFSDFFEKDDYDKLHRAYGEAFKGQHVSVETKFIATDGQKYFREICLHPIFLHKEIVEIAAIAQDITVRKKYEIEILNKQSQLSAIINTTGDIIFSIDREYRIVEFNNILKYTVRLLQNRELVSGMSVFDILPARFHKEVKKTFSEVFGGESITVLETVFQIEGKGRVYESHYNPIKEGSKITGIAIFSRDITNQKKGEEEMLKSLKEKEVLLKEVHHRVKNNLQVISSILNLQTAYLRDRGTINILKECQNRIKTMAFIHESLYQSTDFSEVNFGEYIITLVKNLFYSFETNQQKIRPNFDVDPIFLNLDLSIPCGLIINELVSNALKYAFDVEQEGTIFVQIKRVNKKIKMMVADNGIGIPDEVNFKNTETLGLQLVVTLTEQINGTIEMKKDKGTQFEIIF